MTRRKQRTPSSILLLPLALLAGTLTLAAQGTQLVGNSEPDVQPQGVKGGFGKPQSIAGKLTLVKPQEGLVIITRSGPNEPASTQLSGTETRDPKTNEVVKTDTITATPGPGETRYRFRVTTHSLLKAGSQRLSLAELTQFQNQPAIVHFIPERSGNFVLGLEVNQ
jgi:hypothetical protein